MRLTIESTLQLAPRGNDVNEANGEVVAIGEEGRFARAEPRVNVKEDGVKAKDENDHRRGAPLLDTSLHEKPFEHLPIHTDAGHARVEEALHKLADDSWKPHSFEDPHDELPGDTGKGRCLVEGYHTRAGAIPEGEVQGLALQVQKKLLHGPSTNAALLDRGDIAAGNFAARKRQCGGDDLVISVGEGEGRVSVGERTETCA